jgi:L-ascorbate metabolism protein UlaG (beta-lactamase superfamily)
MAIHIKLLGHASFQIKAERAVIYVDLRKYGGVIETSEKADLILITHSHADHFSSEKIEKIRKEDTVTIAPKKCVSKIGGEVKTLQAGEDTIVDDIRVRAVETYNYKRFRPSGKPWHPKGYGVGYLISIGDKTIYHAGDTDFIPEMKQLGHVDVALLPTGDKYTMDNVEAAEATLAINPKVVVPMHCWKTNPREFKKKVTATSNIKVVLLEKGEEYQLV